MIQAARLHTTLQVLLLQFRVSCSGRSKGGGLFGRTYVQTLRSHSGKLTLCPFNNVGDALASDFNKTCICISLWAIKHYTPKTAQDLVSQGAAPQRTSRPATSGQQLEGRKQCQQLRSSQHRCSQFCAQILQLLSARMIMHFKACVRRQASLQHRRGRAVCA